MNSGINVRLRTVRIVEFSKKQQVCPRQHSSLAIASNDPRLASDELHRSP